MPKNVAPKDFHWLRRTVTNFLNDIAFKHSIEGWFLVLLSVAFLILLYVILR